MRVDPNKYVTITKRRVLVNEAGRGSPVDRRPFRCNSTNRPNGRNFWTNDAILMSFEIYMFQTCATYSILWLDAPFLTFSAWRGCKGRGGRGWLSQSMNDLITTLSVEQPWLHRVCSLYGFAADFAGPFWDRLLFIYKFFINYCHYTAINVTPLLAAQGSSAIGLYHRTRSWIRGIASLGFLISKRRHFQVLFLASSYIPPFTIVKQHFSNSSSSIHQSIFYPFCYLSAWVNYDCVWGVQYSGVGYWHFYSNNHYLDHTLCSLNNPIINLERSSI